MVKVFIVTLLFHKIGVARIVKNHYVYEASESLALDEVLKVDGILQLIKEGYFVEATIVDPIGYGFCPQNSPHHYSYLTSYETDEPIGVYINLQITQTPELSADLTALMKKHYQVNLSL